MTHTLQKDLIGILNCLPEWRNRLIQRTHRRNRSCWDRHTLSINPEFLHCLGLVIHAAILVTPPLQPPGLQNNRTTKGRTTIEQVINCEEPDCLPQMFVGLLGSKTDNSGIPNKPGFTTILSNTIKEGRTKRYPLSPSLLPPPLCLSLSHTHTHLKNPNEEFKLKQRATTVQI